MNAWNDFDALHIPPADEMLELEIEYVEGYGKHTIHTIAGYYDKQLGEFRQPMFVRSVRGNVLRWKLQENIDG